MQMSDPPELISHSLVLSATISFLLVHFFFQQTPTAGEVATSHAEHIDILNLTVEAVHHNSSMLVCCLSFATLSKPVLVYDATARRQGYVFSANMVKYGFAFVNGRIKSDFHSCHVVTVL